MGNIEHDSETLDRLKAAIFIYVAYNERIKISGTQEADVDIHVEAGIHHTNTIYWCKHLLGRVEPGQMRLAREFEISISNQNISKKELEEMLHVFENLAIRSENEFRNMHGEYMRELEGQQTLLQRPEPHTNDFGACHEYGVNF